jgi:hypothetical protein
MIRIRPLAGAVLTMLMLISPALADKVDVIIPGGNAELRSSISAAPADTGASSLSRTASDSSEASSSSDYSPTESEPQPGLQTRHFGGVTLKCEVAASRTDLVVINDSREPLPPGTRIKWQLKKEGTRGFFAIIGELGGGESLVADGVLGSPAGPDDVCVARVI